MFLRQSTASQEILLGRFLDSTDGNTAETGLTIANTDIKLFKSGATTLADKNSGGATHIASGLYYTVLDATDTNTIGNLEVHVHVAGALTVMRTFTVLDEAVYDALFGTTALATATNITAGTITTVTNLTNLPSIPNNWLTAAGINADAITAAKVAADVGTEIGTAVWATTTRLLTAGTNIVLAKGTGVTGFNDLDAGGIRTAVGLASANLDTQLTAIDDFLDTEVGAIKAKTDNLPADPADASDIAASFTTVNNKLDTIDDFLDTEIAAIKAKTDSLTFTVAGQVDSNIQYVNDVEVAGDGEPGTEWNPA